MQQRCWMLTATLIRVSALLQNAISAWRAVSRSSAARHSRSPKAQWWRSPRR
jgi:hypothetical protein